MILNGDPVFDRNGNFSGYRGTGREVTAEVEAKGRLAQANADLELGRQRFDAVLSNIILSAHWNGPTFAHGK
jgi:hypothetical protein